MIFGTTRRNHDPKRSAAKTRRAPMKKILITGMSGVGKSSAVEALRNRGYRCIDMDEPGWSYIDKDGHQHWNVERLSEELCADESGPVFVAGCAEEQSMFYPQFSARVLLSAPLDVMEARIMARKNNCYGKDPNDMMTIISNLQCVEPMLRRSCTHEIVTTCPLVAVVEQIETITAEQGAQPDAFGAG
jgi:hypothetical protein